MERETGRTTRMLVNACMALREGTVLILGSTEMAAQDLAARAEQISIAIHGPKHPVRFLGAVHTVWPRPKHNVLFVDHAVNDFFLRQVAREWGIFRTGTPS